MWLSKTLLLCLTVVGVVVSEGVEEKRDATNVADLFSSWSTAKGLLNVAGAVTEALVVERDAGSDLLAEIESTVTCAGCAALLVLLKTLADLGDKAFVDTFTEVCILAKVDDPDVCTGAVGEEGPIIAQSLRTMIVPSHTAQLFCVTLLGLCPFPPVTPYNVSFPSPKPSTTRPAPSGQSPIQLVHFSDIHVDLFYEAGASYNCTKPICCRPYTAADAPGNNSYPAGPYGNTKCDAPLTLEESMYAAIADIAPNASFSLFTGDIVDHAVWLVNEPQNLKDINDAYSRMSGLKRVYGTVGNHEPAPVNAVPPQKITTANNTQQWLYDALSADWEQWIGANASQEELAYGAYSSLVPNTKLRIISINTNLYYKQNFWLYEQTMEADPNGQFAWLVNTLQAAEVAGERVYIIGHMAMGLNDALHDPSNYFDQIVNRYSATIAALFFGHTHVDQFEIAYSNYTNQIYQNALEVSYIAPSMTPTSGPPAFQVYTIDPVTYGVLDATTYIANISSPDYQTKGPVWEKFYSAKEAYGSLVTPALTDPAAELTPAFWHNVTEAFESNSTAFQEYISRKNRGFDVNPCTGTCQTNEICGMRAAQSQYNCATITPGINFKKRDLGFERSMGHVEQDVCEGSLVRPIMTKIAAQHGLLEDIVARAQAKYKKRGMS